MEREYCCGISLFALHAVHFHGKCVVVRYVLQIIGIHMPDLLLCKDNVNILALALALRLWSMPPELFRKVDIDHCKAYRDKC